MALLKLRVELGMKPTSWLNCGFDLNYGETITSHHNLGSATNISTSAFFPPPFLFHALGIFLLRLDSHNFGSLTSEQCWQLCMPVLTSQLCTATYSCTAHKPLQSEGQTTPGKIKGRLICLLPTPFIYNLNAFKNTTGSLLICQAWQCCLSSPLGRSVGTKSWLRTPVLIRLTRCNKAEESALNNSSLDQELREISSISLILALSWILHSYVYLVRGQPGPREPQR